MSSTAIVTGANSGIGLPTAIALAQHGMRVVVASRSTEKGEAAAAHIRTRAPGAEVVFSRLDLADLSSVREFASGVEEVRLLVNNAGIGMIPRGETKDGFELQFGTNHLGHFALTGLLLPLLLKSPGARVINVSSDAHKMGRLDFGNLGLEKGYGRMSSYGRSKLANLLFTYELKRKADRAGADLLTAATHPGATATNFFNLGPFNFLTKLFLHSAEAGAVPSVHAALSSDVRGGEFFGPKKQLLTPSKDARSPELAARLWEVSTELTGVRFDEIA
ncbi:oxidoreductase [Nonomuraea sp. NPDC050556]|uniref:oxidoreductase n=1 Tax=Nonomuraea sp. NPDC050556 TaxID=3364369 RepID=UPI0037AED0A2